MKPITRMLVGIAVSLALFVCAVIGEAWLRRTQTEQMSINGPTIAGVEVTGAHMPDFLWSGRAWWIDLDTDRPLVLTLDDWTGRVPAGVHRVYSNHDHTNTDDYSDREYWGFPKTVSIRAATP